MMGLNGIGSCTTMVQINQLADIKCSIVLWPCTFFFMCKNKKKTTKFWASNVRINESIGGVATRLCRPC